MNSESKENTSSGKVNNATIGGLIIVALVLSYFLYQKITTTGTPAPAYTDTQNAPPATETQDNITAVAPDRFINPPISKNHPGVESVKTIGEDIQYFFAGTIKEVKPLADSTQIILENGAGLPTMILPKTSPPSGITQVPDGSPKIQLLPHATLKPGIYVQVLMYFNIKSNIWTLRDVFIPSEKNK